MIKENEKMTLPAIAHQVLMLDQRIAELDKTNQELAARFDTIEVRLASLASLEQRLLHLQNNPLMSRGDAAASAGEDGAAN